MRHRTRILFLTILASQTLFLFSGCAFGGMSRMMSAMWNRMM